VAAGYRHKGDTLKSADLKALEQAFDAAAAAK
jgi:hypothetical protein